MFFKMSDYQQNLVIFSLRFIGENPLKTACSSKSKTALRLALDDRTQIQLIVSVLSGIHTVWTITAIAGRINLIRK
jgi:hypothetical protein